MSSSDSESTCSDLTSVAGSPVIQDLDITMATDSTVGSGDDGTDSDGKTAQMIATNSSSASASTAQTSASTAQILVTNSSSASASTAQILATNSSSASASIEVFSTPN